MRTPANNTNRVLNDFLSFLIYCESTANWAVTLTNDDEQGALVVTIIGTGVQAELIQRNSEDSMDSLRQGRVTVASAPLENGVQMVLTGVRQYTDAQGGVTLVSR